MMRVDPLQLGDYHFARRNEYVSNHTCQACPTGTYNATGDPASDGPDTVCDSILCNNNYYVSDHKCIVCAPGKYNDGGDDTKWSWILYVRL